MVKYGFQNITVIDGDEVEEKNITAQLSYDDIHVQHKKVEVLKQRFNDKITTYDDFLTVKNISNIFDTESPDYVFCCADDPLVELHKLLLERLEVYNYKLFITGYSQDEVMIQYISNESLPTFRQFYELQEVFDIRKTISHNTGTIVKGMLNSSLLFNFFLKSLYSNVDDIYFINLNTLKVYNQNFTNLNLMEFERQVIFRNLDTEIFKLGHKVSTVAKEQRISDVLKKKIFNYYYYVYLKYLQNESSSELKYKLSFLDRLFKTVNNGMSYTENDEFSIFISEFELFRRKYYTDNGFPLLEYKNKIHDNSAIEKVYQNFSDFVMGDDFKNRYNELLVRRKRYIGNINSQIVNMYSWNCMESVKNAIETTVKTDSLNAIDILKFEFVELKRVSIEDSIKIICEAMSSQFFSNHVLKMFSNNFIDYKMRKNKSQKNVTLYNPITSTSKIIMNFDENKMGLLCLVHELTHSYVYDLFKDRLSLDNMEKIPKVFWEVFAKIGELFVLDYIDDNTTFMKKSYYQVVFSLIDYELMSCGSDCTLDKIMEIKNNILKTKNINPELFKYTQYNFINYPMLYSKGFSAYDSLYSDMIAKEIFKKCRKNNYDFDDLMEKIKNVVNLNLVDLLEIFNLSYKEIEENYCKHLNAFLRDHFLEDYK